MTNLGIRLAAIGAGLTFWAAPALAAPTVECHAIDYQYTECSAGSLTRPQLIHQISSSPCILNRTWGYNPRSGYLWVAEGCAGVFADVAGYHYGRGDGADNNARAYNNRGHDVGAAIGGAIIGALVAGMLDGNKSSNYHHETTNNHNSKKPPRNSGYSGCHGVGCLATTGGPPEPGQSEFRREGASDAPPEPGQTSFTPER